MLQDLGIPLEDCLGKTANDFYSPELAEKYQADDQRVLAGETLTLVEENIAPATGQKRYVEVTKVPIRDAAGVVIGIQGIYWDISDRIQTEQALLLSENRYRVLSELTSDYVYSVRSAPVKARITWSDGRRWSGLRVTALPRSSNRAAGW